MVHNSSEAWCRCPWVARTLAAVNAFAAAFSSAADNGRAPGSCEGGYRQDPLDQEDQAALFVPPLAACTAEADTDPAFAAAELDDHTPEARGVLHGNHLRIPWKGGHRNLHSDPRHLLARTSEEQVLAEVASLEVG
jgi:hypothetical protein